MRFPCDAADTQYQRAGAGKFDHHREEKNEAPDGHPGLLCAAGSWTRGPRQPAATRSIAVGSGIFQLALCDNQVPACSPSRDATACYRQTDTTLRDIASAGTN